MSLRKVLLCLLALVLSLTGAATGQSTLAAGDVGLVTTTGFFRLRAAVTQGQPVNHLAPSAFNSGFTSLVAPRLDWERGTDSFLVSTGTWLYRVTVTSNTTATVTDLTPNVGGSASFTELDIHPGTGDLYLFDQSSQLVYRFVPPFAANMTPDLVLSSGSGKRAMCLDSRDYPSSVTVASTAQTDRLPLDGSSAIAVAYAGASGVDGDPQFGRTFMVSKSADLVSGSVGSPSLVQQLNIVGLCAPVALGPTAVAYNTTNFRCFVLAEDGIDPTCFPGVTGGNQVVSLPPAVSSTVFPVIITDPSGSGITGTDGDLALVLDEFAFPSPYGDSCLAPSTGTGAVLDCNAPPYIGSSSFTLEVSLAPPNKPIFMLFGYAPLAQLQTSGCTVLVTAAISPFYIGTTDGSGNLSIASPIPSSAPAGAQTYQQVAFVDSGYTILSNGLLLHFGP